MKSDIIFLKKIWIRYKNSTLDIIKSKINKNSKYKIFLNKTQFDNLLDKGFIKYRLSDAKKQKHLKKEMGLDLFYQWLSI